MPANRPVAAPKSSGMVIRAAEPDDDEGTDLSAAATRGAPPWLVSLVVHAVLLIVAALIVFTQAATNQIFVEATYSEEEGEQLLDDSLDQFAAEQMPEVTEAVMSEDVVAVDDPFAAPPDLTTVADPTSASSDVNAPSIGLALTGREKGAKRALLAAYGGTKRTEASVYAALQWLKRQQRPNGRWSLVGPYTEGGINENEAAATAMALLAFQGAGNTHQSGEFKAQVAKGLDELLKMFDADGAITTGTPSNHRLYTQAQCTIALIELYGMTKDPKLQGPAQRALDYASRIQAPEGGWRYRPLNDSDTSVTGWFVMALQSGRMSSLTVKEETLKNVERYLEAASSDSGARYAYQPGDRDSRAMTAEGLLCRQYLGFQQTDSRLTRGVSYLLTQPIELDSHDVYYWYYATQVLHHMGGEDWDKWNNVMRKVLPDTQVQDGAEAGSWNPGRDAWAGHGGRLYITCLSCFMLEVYYRHMPLYKHF